MGRQTRNTVFRGDPEQKLIKLRDDFSGGVNMNDSDDLMDENEVRYAYNLNIDEQGDISSRKGWTIIDGMSLINNNLSGEFEDMFELGKNIPAADLRKDIQRGHNILPNKQVISELGTLPMLLKGEELFFKGGTHDERITTSVSIVVKESGKPNRVISNVETCSLDKVSRIVVDENFKQSVNNDGNVIQAYVQLTCVNNTSSSISEEFVVRGNIWRKRTDGVPTKVQDIISFEIVENEGNLWQNLTSASGLGEAPTFQIDKGSIGFIMLRLKDDVIEVLSQRYTYDDSQGFKLDKEKFIPIGKLLYQPEPLGETIGSRLNEPLQLMSKNVGRFGGKLYYTLKNYATAQDFGGISNLISIEYNAQGEDLIKIEQFGKISNRGTVKNLAYKPSPQEIRHVGFNMLGDEPLSWIDSSGISTNSIQGVFITTTDKRIPINNIPHSNTFDVNVMYTGNIGAKHFSMKFYEVVGYDEDTKAPKRNEIKSTMVKRDISSQGVYVGKVTLNNAPTGEVEIEIKFPDDENVGTYYDYYTPGAISPESKPIESLKIGHFEIAQVWDRFVYYKGDTMWYNDVNRPDYIPNFNYIRLPLDADDEITKIIFFRSSYIIFTRKKIYKLQGDFVDGVAITLVNDTLGCIAPNSVQMVGSELIFLSGHGLFSLKSELFRQDLENVKRLDNKIPTVIPRLSHAFSYTVDDQYVLMLNNHRQRIQNPEYYNKVNILSRQFRAPDVIRYYTDTESFMFDVYDQEFPWFVFEHVGSRFGINNSGIYKANVGTTDFGGSIPIYLETQGMDFDYPTHEKKYKKMTIKLGVDAFLEDISFDFYVDGMHSYEKVKWNTHLYDTRDLENSRHLIERIRIPSRKGKNMAIIMTANTLKQVSLKALSFEYKLGKIRE